MKKSLKIIMSGLFLCSALLFSACGTPTQYWITTNPSDSSLGSVVEASDVNLNSKGEGTKITLTAKENTTTNPFVCWIKDYKLVVANQKELHLTYNASSAGNYTAVFNESTQNKMMFASLSSVSFSTQSDVEYGGYSTIDYTINYSILSSGSTNFSVFTSGHFNLAERSQSTDNRSVIYFGKAGADYNYVINVDVTLKNATGKELQKKFEFNEFVNKSNFDNDGVLNISQEEDLSDATQILEGALTLTFKKINTSTNFGF